MNLLYSPALLFTPGNKPKLLKKRWPLEQMALFWNWKMPSRLLKRIKLAIM